MQSFPVSHINSQRIKKRHLYKEKIPYILKVHGNTLNRVHFHKSKKSCFFSLFRNLLWNVYLFWHKARGNEHMLKIEINGNYFDSCVDWDYLLNTVLPCVLCKTDVMQFFTWILWGLSLSKSTTKSKTIFAWHVSSIRTIKLKRGRRDYACA